MVARKYVPIPDDEREIDRYITRRSGSDRWKTIIKSTIEQMIGIIGKPIVEITTDDLFKARDIVIRSDYSQNYRRKLIYNMKNFFVWYFEQKKINNSEILAMKVPKGQWKTKSPKDMLSTDDIETLLKSCKTPRDRCFCAMLWDGSNRPIELLRLTWEDIISDEYGYFFTTNAKTGKNRHIRLTISIPYLDEWRRNYPGDASGNNPVFVTSCKYPDGKHHAWQADGARSMIQVLREATGIKNLKPSYFRPSRITHDMKNKVDMAYIMKKNWGTLKTTMLETYTNLDQEYLDQTALRHAGMARVADMKEQKTHKIEPPVCPKCQTMNTLGSQFCSRCQNPLTDFANKQVEELKTLVGNSPEALEAYIEKMVAAKIAAALQK